MQLKKMMDKENIELLNKACDEIIEVTIASITPIAQRLGGVEKHIIGLTVKAYSSIIGGFFIDLTPEQRLKCAKSISKTISTYLKDAAIYVSENKEKINE